MVTNDEVSKIIYEHIKDELERKPLTREEIHNPMHNERKEALYNAILCYDETGNVCGYNIQVRLEEKEIYKQCFYLPIIDASWNGVKNSNNLPDKKVKIGYDGKYQSQNELLKKNDIEQGLAMFLNLKSLGLVYLGEGFVGLTCSDVLYNIARNFKFAGYPTNEATKKMNESKSFA